MIKYFTLLFFIGILCGLGFSGCEKNLTDETSASNNANSETQYVELSAFNQMQALNESLLMTKTTRGWGDWFLKSCAIAGADIGGFGTGVGAVIGIAVMTGAATGGTGAAVVMGIAGTICSVGASYAAFRGCYGRTVRDPKIDYSTTYELTTIGGLAVAEVDAGYEIYKESEINLPEEFAYLNKMGVLHNVMLEKIEAVESGQLNLSEVCVDADPELVRIVDSEAFTQAYEAIVDAVIASQNDFGSINVDQFCGAEGIKITENAAKAYQLFLDAYNQFPKDITDVKLLVNEYIKIIENSNEFTDEDKVQIYGGLAVAANSPLYWQDKLESYECATFE